MCIRDSIGVEQGLMRSVADRVNAYDSAKQLDFIIGSSHLVYGEDPYYPEFWEKRSAKDTVLTYYESILDNLSCCHNFDAVSYTHLDVYKRQILPSALLPPFFSVVITTLTLS